MRNFTKVKNIKEGLVFEWETTEGPEKRDQGSHRLASYDLPHPDLLAALRGLISPVLRLLELPSMWAGSVTVSGVSITYEEKRGRGAVITLQKQLTDCPAPLILNTPYLPEDAGEHGVSLPTEIQERIDAVFLEAEAFLQGKRAQGSLFPTATAA